MLPHTRIELSGVEAPRSTCHHARCPPDAPTVVTVVLSEPSVFESMALLAPDGPSDWLGAEPGRRYVRLFPSASTGSHCVLVDAPWVRSQLSEDVSSRLAAP